VQSLKFLQIPVKSSAPFSPFFLPELLLLCSARLASLPPAQGAALGRRPPPPAPPPRPRVASPSLHRSSPCRWHFARTPRRPRTATLPRRRLCRRRAPMVHPPLPVATQADARLAVLLFPTSFAYKRPPWTSSRAHRPAASPLAPLSFGPPRDCLLGPFPPQIDSAFTFHGLHRTSPTQPLLSPDAGAPPPQLTPAAGSASRRPPISGHLRPAQDHWCVARSALVLFLPWPLTAGELHGRILAGPEPSPPPAMTMDPIALIDFFPGGSLLNLRTVW
jgi:hypothetical protein